MGTIRWLLTAMVVLVTTSSATAQTLKIDDVDPSQWPIVIGKASLADSNGKLKPIGTLWATDESGRTVVVPLDGCSESQEKIISLASSLDVSGSMGGTIGGESEFRMGLDFNERAFSLFDSLKTEMSFVGFDDAVVSSSLHQFSWSSIESTISSTTLGNGNDFVAQLLDPTHGLLTVSSNSRPKRIAIIETDAVWSDLPPADYDAALQECLRDGIEFYALIIYPGNPPSFGIIESLQKLCDATGGKLYHISSAAALEDVLYDFAARTAGISKCRWSIEVPECAETVTLVFSSSNADGADTIVVKNPKWKTAAPSDFSFYVPDTVEFAQCDSASFAATVHNGTKCHLADTVVLTVSIPGQATQGPNTIAMSSGWGTSARFHASFDRPTTAIGRLTFTIGGKDTTIPIEIVASKKKIRWKADTAGEAIGRACDSGEVDLACENLSCLTQTVFFDGSWRIVQPGDSVSLTVRSVFDSLKTIEKAVVVLEGNEMDTIVASATFVPVFEPVPDSIASVRGTSCDSIGRAEIRNSNCEPETVLIEGVEKTIRPGDSGEWSLRPGAHLVVRRIAGSIDSATVTVTDSIAEKSKFVATDSLILKTNSPCDPADSVFELVNLGCDSLEIDSVFSRDPRVAVDGEKGRFVAPGQTVPIGFRFSPDAPGTFAVEVKIACGDTVFSAWAVVTAPAVPSIELVPFCSGAFVAWAPEKAVSFDSLTAEFYSSSEDFEITAVGGLISTTDSAVNGATAILSGKSLRTVTAGEPMLWASGRWFLGRDSTTIVKLVLKMYGEPCSPELEPLPGPAWFKDTCGTRVIRSFMVDGPSMVVERETAECPGGSILVFDEIGRIVASGRDSVDLSSLRTGSYFVLGRRNGLVSSKKAAVIR